MADPDFSGTATALADDAVERLVAYARHETPTGDAEALNALADALGARTRERGARTGRVAGESGDHLVAGWGDGDAPHVLLRAHHDTVWPRGSLESMPLTVEGGVLRGPG